MDQFSWSLALKGKQSLEEVLSLTIFVLIALALPIAVHVIWEINGRWEFYKIGLGYPLHMSDLRELGEGFLSNTCWRNFVFEKS
jgi:hypothetical protein